MNLESSLEYDYSLNNINKLNECLNYSKNNKSFAVSINQRSFEKPDNATIFNHSIPESVKETFMIDGNIFWFPDSKAMFGVTIKNPKEQYIFCNEIYDCIAIAGTARDKFNNLYLFGTHVYVSLTEYQMKNIVDELRSLDLTLENVLYSPREDSFWWREGLEVLRDNFLNVVDVLRLTGRGQTEMIVGKEGVLLNGLYYDLLNF